MRSTILSAVIFLLGALFPVMGYTQKLASGKALSDVEQIHLLVGRASQGVNLPFQINGVEENGVPDSLESIKSWLQINGEALGRVKKHTLKSPWGHYTKARNVVYAHVFDWPLDGRLSIDKQVKVNNAWLLTNPDNPLKIEMSKHGDVLVLPKEAPDQIVSVIKLHVIPSDDWPNLGKYAAANAKLDNPANSENRVVFMGNSITERWDRYDSTFFPSYPYINRGISGQTTAQMLLRFRQDVIELQPKVVVIHAGTNDLASNRGPVTVEQIVGNISSMAELARANGIKVVLAAVLPAVSYSWRPGVEPADKIIELNALIKGYAKRNKIIYLDYYTPMVNDQKGLKKEYGRDTVHPNSAGYQLMRPLVHEAIAKALKQ